MAKHSLQAAKKLFGYHIAGILHTHLFTHGVLYIKGMLDKLNHRQIPGLSRKLNFNIQDC